MTKILLAILILLIVTTYFTFTTLLKAPERPVRENAIYTQINAERSSKGLNTLNYDPILEREAQERAERLCNIVFDHAEFNAELASSGYIFKHAGENLAQSNGWGSNEIVQGWFNSPTHYDNLMQADYTETGIGIAVCPTSKIVVQWFGTK